MAALKVALSVGWLVAELAANWAGLLVGELAANLAASMGFLSAGRLDVEKAEN